MTLSTLAAFDDLRRCNDVLNDGLAEEEFLKFVQMFEECQLQWLGAVQEARRLQRELDQSLQSMSDLEGKLFHARRLLETEHKACIEAEKERSRMEKKLMAVSELLRNERDIKEETRDKLAFLNSFSTKRKSSNIRREEKLGNEINSTGSFLSDFSITQSEEDFLDPKPTKAWKKHRPSFQKNEVFLGVKKSRVSTEGKRQSVSNKVVEIGPSDKIVAHTKVTVPPEGTGPILAESTIEAIPYRNIDTDKRREQPRSPKRKSANKTSTAQFTPSAPPLSDINTRNTPQYAFKKSLLRGHNFSSKTFLKSDTCSSCEKKIRFGSVALRCRECRVCIHNDCRNNLKVACVPQSAGTPTIKGFMGYVTDYAPAVGPMVPALLVHCVNEIETRGLNEVGIYRVSGAERDVKSLKERFLRGKGIPFLGNIDVHVLCGCVKDFLRSLREPLIPTHLWKDFSNAVQNISPDAAKNDLLCAIDRLPQANRDTLAFLIQHFQRVATCPEIKMPIENIARVFGPTIVGYSSLDPDQHAIFTETVIQFSVMERLMYIPTDYWSRYVNIDHENMDDETNEMTAARSLYATPVKGTLRKERKYYATPPYPASSSKKK